MVKKILLRSLALLLLPHAALSLPAYVDLHPSFIVGSGYTRIGTAQNLWLANSPEPGLENTYTSGGQQRGTFLLGFALEQTITNQNNIEGVAGLEIDFVKNPSINGIVQPMVNVAPDFDTLNYSYDMTSYLLEATAKLSKLNILPGLGAYLQAGAGGTLNRLSDYTEVSPAGSSAAPMLEPFGNETTIRFAYSLGAGVFYQVGDSSRFAIGYRYINAGSASLDKSPVQQSNQSLNISPLSYHFVIFSLTV